MTDTVRCKFKLDFVTEKLGPQAEFGSDGKVLGYKMTSMYDARFSAVYSDKAGSENKQFWDATPSGTITLTTIKHMPWKIGAEYYIDITSVI